MPQIDVNGKSYETDEEGYLLNLAEWNMDIAAYIAKTESLEMTDNHWEVVNFLREYFDEYQIAPNFLPIAFVSTRTAGAI